MAIDQTTEDSKDSRLNELYWSSSRTIDEIVDELGVGRNTLYASIEPLQTGMACSTCGDSVAFTNRTNRASGTGTCVACGMEIAVSEDANAAAHSNGRRNDRDSGSGMLGRWRDDLDLVAPERAALIGGAAALGLVFGAAAVRALRD